MYKRNIQSVREAVEFVGHKEQQMVLDSLACMFHNEGYFLKGNTAEYDDEWFARQMWNQQDNYQEFDQQSPEVKEEYIKYARLAMKALPMICERIADRYIAASKAIRSMEIELRTANSTCSGRPKPRR